MTAARLSPAASLLRNSKLFALPQAVALPDPEPSSEPVPRSDTATTHYPTRAAIETPYTSLGRGDWGFKRPLPLKSTTKSGSPSVRLNKGIDTAEHIADFDSAADHVLTLKKFQEFNQSIQLPKSSATAGNVHYSVFRDKYDNTTNLSTVDPAQTQYTGVWPSLSPAALQKQKPSALKLQKGARTAEDNFQGSQAQAAKTKTPDSKRWRYDGPSLVQMSGLEFDRWIKTIDSSKRKAFRDMVRQDLLTSKKNTAVANAQDEGTVGEIDTATLQISEEELTEHLRKLRQQPRVFGQLIAQFLDLPDGPRGMNMKHLYLENVWNYGRQTLASENYEETGPPRTHPSAGLSYIRSDRWAANHAVFGPQDKRLPAVARHVKTRSRGHINTSTLGLAGFVVEKNIHKGTREQNPPAFELQPGGQKSAIRPDSAEITETGMLRWTVQAAPEYSVEGTNAVHKTLSSLAAPLSLASRPGQRVMPPLYGTTRAQATTYKKREDINSGDADLDFLGRAE